MSLAPGMATSSLYHCILVLYGLLIVLLKLPPWHNKKFPLFPSTDTLEFISLTMNRLAHA